MPFSNMSDTRRNQYFIPGEGIAREVITADICKYLDNDALVRPGNYQGIDGYYIFAYRNLTKEMIEDLKNDSRKWEGEKRGRMGGQRNARAPADQYIHSRTHASRLESGPSYSDDYGSGVSGGMGGSMNSMSGSARSGGVSSTSMNSRQNPSPYSNDGAYTYQPPPSNDFPPTSGAGVGHGSAFGSSSQPRSAGIHSTSAAPYANSSSAGGYGGGMPTANGSYGGGSSGGFGGHSTSSGYGSSSTNAYAPPPSTAPAHGRGGYADASSGNRSSRVVDSRSGGYDHGHQRPESHYHADTSRGSYGDNPRRYR